MNDRSPIVQHSSLPPAYVQTASNATTSLNTPSVCSYDQVNAPPPYTPSSSAYSYDHGGPYYQKFDIVANNQVEILALCHLGPEPCQIRCPSCGKTVTTIIYHKAGTLTFLSAVLCFLFCIVCTFLPFCVNELQDVEHHCPNCKFHLGTYTRI